MLEISGIGRLTKNIELITKNTGKGATPFCKLSLAFDNGKDNAATFVDFDCWGEKAKNHAKYLEKGSQVYVKGAMVPNNYEKDGMKVYSNNFIAKDVEYLSSRKSAEKGLEA